jgi:hypothetical protein
MPFMSYCRFENTLPELVACAEHLEDSLSEAEHEARKAMIRVCRQIVADLEDMDERDIDGFQAEDED